VLRPMVDEIFKGVLHFPATTQLLVPEPKDNVSFVYANDSAPSFLFNRINV